MRRLIIMIAALGALLLIPAAQAFAANNAFVEIEGSGSGEVIPVPGEEEYAGKTGKINCKYTSPGPATGTCATEAFEEEGFRVLKVKGVAAPGSVLAEWKVLKGTKIANTCEATNFKTITAICGVSAKGEIKIKAVFTKANVHITIAGSGSGSVVGAGVTAEKGTPPVNCSYVSPGPRTGACEVLSGLVFGFEAVQVEAKPVAGSEFTGWTVEEGEAVSGGCAEEAEDPLEPTCVVLTEAPAEIKIKANFHAEGPTLYPLSVNKTGSGSGTVTSSPAGINCGSKCSAEFEEGAEVTLSAAEAGGSEFTGWSGSGCSGTGTCKVTMSAAKEVTANFDEEVAITPNLALNVEEGEGTVVSNPAGLECSGSAPKTCEAAVAEGKVTLTASPAPGYLVKSWKGCDPGGVNGRQCTVTATSSLKTVGVKFYKVFSLEGSKSGGLGIMGTAPGGINCGYACSSSTALYKEGGLTVKAKPAKNFHFVEFKGGTGSASSCNGVKALECTIATFNSNSAIEEVYAEDAKNTLTLTKEGGGQGFVKTKPTNINCGLTCTAAKASFFASESPEVTVALGKGTSSVTWTTGAGTCTGNALTCSVPMSSAHSLVAKFN